MSATVPELRTPVMTLVEASWEDPTGAWHTGTARMEDRSTGGACIRVKTAVSVGSRMRIQWRFDQFFGTAKYCRQAGKEYLVGIQRDSTKSADPVLEVSASREKVPTAVLTVKTQPLPKLEEIGQTAIPVQQRSERSAPVLRSADYARAAPRGQIRFQASVTHRAGIPQPRQSGNLQEAEPKQAEPTEPLLRPKKAGKERKPMARKWLELTPWHSKQGGHNPSGGGEGTASSPQSSYRSSDISIDEENRMAHISQPTEKPSAHGAREVPNFRVELLPMEDIYRGAGIMNPRRGYSINKIVEMVHSEHSRLVKRDEAGCGADGSRCGRHFT